MNLSPMSQDYLNRFSAMARLHGSKVLERLANAHMVVIGIGGVGSWTAEALARSGVGKLTLIDLDEVCVTNTNRQLHALHNTIGQPKVHVLKERLSLINPDLEVEAVMDFLTADTIENLLSKKSYDVVIDAIDSLKNKTLLAAYCRQQNLPLITVGGAGGKSDPTLIRTGDLADSAQDNLLRRLKKKLRRDHDFPRKGQMNILSVYSIERAVYPTPEGETCFKQDLEDKEQAKLDCANGMGTATYATGTFGFAAAKLAVDVIRQKP